MEDNLFGGASNGVELGQVYPNPVTTMAKVNFSIPRPGYVCLKVYNIFGQEVAAPVARVYSAGDHFTILNTDDLPSGIYLYKLEVGNTSITKKMTVVK